MRKNGQLTVSRLGNGGGSAGRVVASDTRDPQIESQHQQYFIYQLYIQIEKTKMKKKGLGMAHLKKQCQEIATRDGVVCSNPTTAKVFHHFK